MRARSLKYHRQVYNRALDEAKRTLHVKRTAISRARSRGILEGKWEDDVTKAVKSRDALMYRLSKINKWMTEHR